MKKYVLLFLITIQIGMISCVRDKDFKTRGKLTAGTVFDIRYESTQSTYSIYYEYYIDSVRYYDESVFPTLGGELRHRLKDKQFPVMYLPEKPNISRLLLTEYEFKAVGLAYPDSLQWVEDLK